MLTITLPKCSETTINFVWLRKARTVMDCTLKKLVNFFKFISVHFREVAKNWLRLFLLREKPYYFLSDVVTAISCYKASSLSNIWPAKSSWQWKRFPIVFRSVYLDCLWINYERQSYSPCILVIDVKTRSNFVKVCKKPGLRCAVWVICVHFVASLAPFQKQ